MATINTFTIAGFETSSLAVTWMLKALSERTDVQARLREEIRSAKASVLASGREELDADELMALPYLDAVVVSWSCGHLCKSDSLKLVDRGSR